MFNSLSPCCYCIASDKQMSLEDNVAQLKQLMDGAGATDKCPLGRFTREKAEHVLKYIMTRYYAHIYSQYTMPVVKCNTQPFTLDTYLQLRTSQYSAMLHQYLSDSPYVLMLATQWQMISLPLLIT